MYGRKARFFSTGRFDMPKQLSQGIRCVAVSLPVLLALACGSDSTAPTPPDVSGFYDVVDVAALANCDPASALDVLEVALSSGTFHIKLRVDQQGGQLTFTELEFEGQNVEDQHISSAATIDGSGTAHIDTERDDQFSILGAATYFEHLTSSAAGQFDAAAHPTTFSFTGTSTHVYRTGSATGPVFATCTQSETDTGTRISG
jgi:hypothetical protein